MNGNVAHFVGLDYHKDSIQVCVMDKEGKILVNRKLPNDIKKLDRFVRRFGDIDKAAVETCTGAACLADKLRLEYKWNIRQAHAGYVKRMKQSPDKTDYDDARILADLCRVDYLPEVWIPHEYIRNLRSLVRRRYQLVKERTAEKLRVRALLRNNRLSPPGSPWSKGWTAWLTTSDDIPESIQFLFEDHLEKIEDLDRRVLKFEKRIAIDTRDDLLIELLMSMRGIGFVTAVVMRAEIADFGRFYSGKQLANFCGVTPRNVSSGQRQTTTGLISAGSPMLRCTIIEAAHRLVRYDDHWSDLHYRLRMKKHKHKCIAIGAVANRWIRKLYHRVNEALFTHNHAV
jgi:transposase